MSSPPFQVPGAEGNFVFIKDAVYKNPIKNKEEKAKNLQLPFPTYFVPEGEEALELEPLVADMGDVDPFMVAD